MREEEGMLSINFSLRPNASDQILWDYFHKSYSDQLFSSRQMDFGRKFFGSSFIQRIYLWNFIVVCLLREGKKILSALERQTTGKIRKFPLHDILNHLFVCGSFDDIVTWHDLHRLSSLNKKIYFLVYAMERKLMLLEGTVAEQQIINWGHCKVGN